MKISDIHINPSNPRTIKDERFKKLVKSISEFPKMMELRPIIVDADGMILGGNMRYKALKELKYKDIPDEWVKRADELTDEEKQRFIIEDNVGFGDWDWETLANEWDAELLTEWGLEIPDFAINKEVTEDDYQIPDEIKTDIVLGDLFEIGQHRLLCGDSTDSDSVAKLMNGQKADMVFTDPPYGIGYSSAKFDNVKPQNQGLSTKRNKAEMIIGDDKPFDPSFIMALHKNTKEIFIWGYQYYPEKLGRGGIIVWNKKTETQSDCAHGDFELCFSKQERNKMFWYTWGGFKNKEKGEERLHTTQKPIKLASYFLTEWGKENNIVVDYFLGSGSTMVASHQLNRKCYGMEIDPKYCQVIVDRMRKLDPSLEIKRNGIRYE